MIGHVLRSTRRFFGLSGHGAPFWGAFRTNTGETYLIRTIDQVSSLHQDRPRLRICVPLGSLGFESRAVYSGSH